MDITKELRKIPKTAIRLFTDGACFPNPGPFGGWAYIIQYQDGRCDVKSKGAERNTTNNRMELMAVIQGLKAIEIPSEIELVTDSEYVGKGIALWMHQWRLNGWKQKNGDLWSILYDLVSFHKKVYVTCIRGHTGQPENEECDRMADSALKELRGYYV